MHPTARDWTESHSRRGSPGWGAAGAEAEAPERVYGVTHARLSAGLGPSAVGEAEKASLGKRVWKEDLSLAAKSLEHQANTVKTPDSYPFLASSYPSSLLELRCEVSESSFSPGMPGAWRCSVKSGDRGPESCERGVTGSVCVTGIGDGGLETGRCARRGPSRRGVGQCGWNRDDAVEGPRRGRCSAGRQAVTPRTGLFPWPPLCPALLAAFALGCSPEG